MDPKRRSANMRQIHDKNTKPELVVRRIVTKLGYRYRLHDKTLPGKPDLTFRRRKRVIFVHGCFWHQHSDCREGRVPGSRTEYWRPKLARNVERDRLHVAILTAAGWEVLTIWECQVNRPGLSEQLNSFLAIDTTAAAPRDEPTLMTKTRGAEGCNKPKAS